MGTRKRLVTTDRFQASGSDGGVYVVVEKTEELHVEMLAGPAQVVRGLKEYRLENGHPVNMHESGRFEIVGHGVTLTRV